METETKRILFVDDEPHLLSALRRMLRGKRREWDMLFADSGPAALALMGQSPADVIVSDMRMPGMDGTELLKRVSERYPGTIRIVLSGQAAEQPVLQLVHYAHQFLAKPCDADILSTTIERACTLHDLLAQPELQQLVARLGTLPSVPELYRQLRQELSSEEASIQKVGEIIGRDPGMSGKILQMVNSAFFALPRQVTRPADAVTLLGLETVGSLVLAAGIFDRIDPAPYREFELERLWLHTTRTAAIARGIATREKLPPALRETAATAGLLHDVGKLVLIGEKPALYRGITALARREGLTMSQAERSLLGTSHTEIGAYLLGLWGLPNGVILAIARHHDLAGETPGEVSPACIVHAADALELELAADGAPPGGHRLDLQALGRLGLSGHLESWRETAAKIIDTEDN